jgi:DNA repair photolyase
MIIRQISCKTALSPSSLPGLNYSLNPYRGCQHNCAYCYVPNVLRIKRESWGGFVDIKSNIPLILAKELKKKKRGVIGLSTVTDPYQSVEKKYSLSRYCLEQILRYDFPVCIQTKSDLVLRDIELISKISDVELLVSIGTLNDLERKAIEPFSSTIQNRLQVVKRFSEIGIKTVVFYGPIYPSTRVNEVPDIVDTFIKFGAKELIIDKLNLKPGIKENIIEAFPPYRNVMRDPSNYKHLYDEIMHICKKRGINAVHAF